jgi:hypothetical protein
MASYHGKNGLVKLGATGGNAAVAEVKKFSCKSVAAVADNTAMGDGWKTHIEGETVNSWSGSLDCNYDHTDTNGQVALAIGVSITLNLYPEGAPSAAHYLTGKATITGIDTGADSNSAVSRSFSFEGNGALTWAVLA